MNGFVCPSFPDWNLPESTDAASPPAESGLHSYNNSNENSKADDDTDSVWARGDYSANVSTGSVCARKGLPLRETCLHPTPAAVPDPFVHTVATVANNKWFHHPYA